MAGARGGAERPSYAELEALIVEQAALIATLRARMAGLEVEVAELRAGWRRTLATLRSRHRRMATESRRPSSGASPVRLAGPRSSVQVL